MSPIVFCDFDDVLCINRLYGGYDVLAPDPPPEMWAQLFHQPAIEALHIIVNEFSPRIVITTSWLRFMERHGFEGLFKKTGLHFISDALHQAWEAPQDNGMTRLGAIERWLATHHQASALSFWTTR